MSQIGSACKTLEESTYYDKELIYRAVMLKDGDYQESLTLLNNEEAEVINFAYLYKVAVDAYLI